MSLKILLAALVVIAAIPAYPQVAPEASANGLPLTVGVGFSNYNSDWTGYLRGPMFWADWSLYQVHGLGIEAEGRDLNYGRNGGVPNLRIDEAGGGPIYTFRPLFRGFVWPYGKYLAQFGSIDFTIPNVPNYHHDTRVVQTLGGGATVRATQSILIRADYEYQFWPDLGHGGYLNPRGLTVGVAYNFRRHFDR
ncbi:MAG TPA: outer membrane beta-barrel protein [Terracidiphilus sp.]|nr:outer membrane beta-barrel protein [Terracidiphilus sp.]